MSDYVAVAKVSDVPNGQVKTFAVDGHRIALCNVDGTYYAIQDLCTHDGGPLGEGEIVDHEIECPRHGGRFDIITGQVTALPPMFPIQTYPVRVVGDVVEVALNGK